MPKHLLPTTSSAPILTSFRLSVQRSPNYLFRQTLHTFRDIKTAPSRGTNSTLEQKSMHLLTSKLTPSMIQETPTAVTKSKASLRTFGMQLTCQSWKNTLFDAPLRQPLDVKSHGTTPRTNESINWRHYGESFKKLSHGRCIQISKYTHQRPAPHQTTPFDFRHLQSATMGGHHPLVNMYLWCSMHRSQRSRVVFQQNLTRMHTPDIPTHLLCNSMDSWLARRPVVMPARNGPEEPIQQQIRRAFTAQAAIGWDQFFCRRIAKEAWRTPIGTY
jgi:hypothetical protein